VVAQLVIFVGISLGTETWKPPQTDGGWVALIAMSIATTAGILVVFLSTVRIGPFRTALIMNLEPLTATVLSALALGEVITPLQGIGSAIMLATLVAFQLWK
jgi:probable blue pigment (indigoidine) exporter